MNELVEQGVFIDFVRVKSAEFKERSRLPLSPCLRERRHDVVTVLG